MSHRPEERVVPRPGWRDLPPRLRRALESLLGATVVGDRSQPAGFSPAFASLVDLDDGRTVFIKAASPEPNQQTPRIHRRELEVAQQLPASVPAPRLLAHHDDGEWIALVFEAVDGRMPGLPWNEADLASLQRALAKKAEFDASGLSLQPAQDRLEHVFSRWSPLADDLDRRPWVRAHFDDLLEFERTWATVVEGQQLVHLDTRADNVVIDAAHQAWLVDWPHAGIGAAWVDELVFLVPAAVGGPPPEHIIDAGGLLEGIPATDIDVAVGAFAGYFVATGTEPPPPGLPTIRQFQRDQALVACRWLSRRLGWPEPGPADLGFGR